MKDHVKVSVIIPMYNRAYTIGRTLESVFRQTLEGIEIIVIDDGSSDDSVEVVKEYQKSHPNLKLLLNEHGGPGPARNTGIEQAQGEYVAFLDSDDVIPERAYEVMYQKATAEGADVIVGQILRRINGGKWNILNDVWKMWELFQDENCAGQFIVPAKTPSCCNKMVSRQLLWDHDLRFPDAIMAEDLFFSSSVFEYAHSAYIIDEVVYLYESDTTNRSSTISIPSPKIINDAFDMLKKLGLKFHNAGQVDAQALNLEGSFQFVLNRFWQLPDGKEKEAVFENIKDCLRPFEPLKEYHIIIQNMFQMDLSTLLLLPYPTYMRQRAMLAKLRPGAAPAAKPAWNPAHGDPANTVLRMYQQGQIGFRYILKYAKAWLKFKLRRA